MNILEKLVTGGVAIALVVAIASRASGVSTAAQGLSKAGGGFLQTVERG